LEKHFDDEIFRLETIYDRQEIPIWQAILGWRPLDVLNINTTFGHIFSHLQNCPW